MERAKKTRGENERRDGEGVTSFLQGSLSSFVSFSQQFDSSTMVFKYLLSLFSCLSFYNVNLEMSKLVFTFIKS